jgi:beta-aspartyl-dipeptidase (metallo-type)
VENSDLPKEQFVPTHLNRSAELFSEAIRYCKSGGNIDLTAGETAGIPVLQALSALVREGVDLSKVTVSSDANGSIPQGGVSKIEVLYEDIRDCILKSGLNPGEAFRLATENVAKVLKLYPQKGVLMEGSDADILITDKNYRLRMLLCMGRTLVKN